ncbi:osmotically-inducible lipoprotein OsmE [Zestomonas thermotolerans]|uniref:osmotically-inducible lipoprotein OsmE n=1 Tax=Zestomonas thermotolerans TaxID=157784 RepID=UPI000372B866|nr:osmotically-inducible lipoprotein OsmE [Pseudomonas thermotolerans]MBO2509939.1 outer membrane protein assembly factor BamE [Gammaproteobacteria bacterium]
MPKSILLPLCLLGAVAGCAIKPENPVDYYTFRNQPLVRQVEDGMSRQEVLRIGGTPSSEVPRQLHPGTCHNYILNEGGVQQPYYVTFDSAGRVDGKGFMTCERHEANRRELEQKL